MRTKSTSLDIRINVIETLMESIAIAARSAVLMANDRDFQERVAEILQSHSDALRDLSGERRSIGFIQKRGR